MEKNIYSKPETRCFNLNEYAKYLPEEWRWQLLNALNSRPTANEKLLWNKDAILEDLENNIKTEDTEVEIDWKKYKWRNVYLKLLPVWNFVGPTILKYFVSDETVKKSDLDKPEIKKRLFTPEKICNLLDDIGRYLLEFKLDGFNFSYHDYKKLTYKEQYKSFEWDCLKKIHWLGFDNSNNNSFHVIDNNGNLLCWQMNWIYCVFENFDNYSSHLLLETE